VQAECDYERRTTATPAPDGGRVTNMELRAIEGSEVNQGSFRCGTSYEPPLYEGEPTLRGRIGGALAVSVILPIIAAVLLLMFAWRNWKALALLGIAVGITALLYAFPNILVGGLLLALTWARYS
jgi:hypothetical protein